VSWKYVVRCNLVRSMTSLWLTSARQVPCWMSDEIGRFISSMSAAAANDWQVRLTASMMSIEWPHVGHRALRDHRQRRHDIPLSSPATTTLWCPWCQQKLLSPFKGPTHNLLDTGSTCSTPVAISGSCDRQYVGAPCDDVTAWEIRRVTWRQHCLYTNMKWLITTPEPNRPTTPNLKASATYPPPKWPILCRVGR